MVWPLTRHLSQQDAESNKFQVNAAIGQSDVLAVHNCVVDAYFNRGLETYLVPVYGESVNWTKLMVVEFIDGRTPEGLRCGYHFGFVDEEQFTRIKARFPVGTKFRVRLRRDGKDEASQILDHIRDVTGPI